MKSQSILRGEKIEFEAVLEDTYIPTTENYKCVKCKHTGQYGL
jgi:hypothetical protein